MRRLPLQYTRRPVLSDFLLKRHSYKENDRKFHGRCYLFKFTFETDRTASMKDVAIKLMEMYCLPWAIQCPCHRWYFSKRTASSYLSASLEVPGGLEEPGYLVCHPSLALHVALWVHAGRAIPRPLLVPRDQHSQGYLGFLAWHNSNFDRTPVQFPICRW